MCFQEENTTNLGDMQYNSWKFKNFFLKPQSLLTNAFPTFPIWNTKYIADGNKHIFNFQQIIMYTFQHPLISFSRVRWDYLLTQISINIDLFKIKTNPNGFIKMHSNKITMAQEHYFKYFQILLLNSFQQDLIFTFFKIHDFCWSPGISSASMSHYLWVARLAAMS